MYSPQIRNLIPLGQTRFSEPAILEHYGRKIYTVSKLLGLSDIHSVRLSTIFLELCRPAAETSTSLSVTVALVESNANGLLIELQADSTMLWLPAAGRFFDSVQITTENDKTTFSGTSLFAVPTYVPDAELIRQATELMAAPSRTELMADLINKNEELDQAKATAESATKAKSDFLANMSHEIRTPMNAVIGLNHLLAKTKLNKKQKDLVRKIQSSAQSLLGIINDILDFSKIEAGKLNLETIPFNINEVLENLSNLISIKVQEKGLELVFSKADDVPAFLIGDPLRLSQILLNLATNAVKFTEEGEIIIYISLVEKHEDEVTLHIAVKDTGIGLTQEQMDRLFQSFHQADNSITRQYGGTGLGLTICKQLAEMMDGEIGVKSELGAGSTFYFTARLGIQKEQERGEIVFPEDTHLNVLIVDDNATCRSVLEHMIRDFAEKVHSTPTGQNAIRILENQDADTENPINLLLLDWQMPGMDGVETAEKILSSTRIPSMPKIIMVTAYGREDVLQKSEELGLDGFMLKPVTESIIHDVLVDVFGCASEISSRFRYSGKEKRIEGLDAIRGARLYLVEDNQINQQVATELLEDEGFYVDLAGNGEIAVKHLTSAQADSRYDIILMDLQMPVKGGLEATREIRQWEKEQNLPPCPIVAMTADAMQGIKQKVYDAGMDDYISKPISPDVVFATLVKWIRPEQRELPASFTGKKQEASSEIPFIKGVDVATGLHQIGNRVDIYRKVIVRFYEQFCGFEDELKGLIQRQEISDAHRLAHTLKGLASSIGAYELQNSAAVLEQIFAENQLDAHETRLDKTVAELTAVLHGIKESGILDYQRQPQQQAVSPYIAEEFDNLTEELQKNVSKRIPKASKESIAKILQIQLPEDIAEKFHQIEERINNYRFKDAAAILQDCLPLPSDLWDKSDVNDEQ